MVFLPNSPEMQEVRAIPPISATESYREAGHILENPKAMIMIPASQRPIFHHSKSFPRRDLGLQLLDLGVGKYVAVCAQHLRRRRNLQAEKPRVQTRLRGKRSDRDRIGISQKILRLHAGNQVGLEVYPQIGKLDARVLAQRGELQNGRIRAREHRVQSHVEVVPQPERSAKEGGGLPRIGLMHRKRGSF
jgi:hypothetical protein